jgi:hypothetical protein
MGEALGPAHASRLQINLWQLRDHCSLSYMAGTAGINRQCRANNSYCAAGRCATAEPCVRAPASGFLGKAGHDSSFTVAVSVVAFP